MIQVPDFGDRFWVYQVVDVRTDSFADLGKMYGTKPGFYLLAGPDWKGEVPQGIARVFRAKTNTGFVDSTRVRGRHRGKTNRRCSPLINQIDMYPLVDVRRQDSSNATGPNRPTFPAQDSGGGAETPWVVPEKFFDELPLVLNDAQALAGRRGALCPSAGSHRGCAEDEKLKAAMIDEAKKTEQELINPLLPVPQLRPAPCRTNWTTQNNGARFGTDYFTRTAVAKSNIFVNKPTETKYFYQDLDEAGTRLNGGQRYTVTFAKGQLPPVKGFWSLTLYDQHHFFAPNEIKRYSVGTKNKDLQPSADGSLTIHVQADAPSDPVHRANWLPAPNGEDFSLYIRAYWPEEAITSGQAGRRQRWSWFARPTRSLRALLASMSLDMPSVVVLEVDNVVLEEDHAFRPREVPCAAHDRCWQRPWISSANVSSTYFAVKV